MFEPEENEGELPSEGEADVSHVDADTVWFDFVEPEPSPPSREELSARSGEDRDRLLRILDQSWPFMAWKIERLKRVEDVPNVFRVCRSYTNHTVLDLLRTQLDQKARTKVKEWTDGDAEHFGEKLAKKQREIERLYRTPEEKEESFHAIVHFTQQQLIDLLTQGRYKHWSPRILANALAGVPSMGYRRSSEIYTKIPSPILIKDIHGGKVRFGMRKQTAAEGPNYQIQCFIEKFLKYNQNFVPSSKPEGQKRLLRSISRYVEDPLTNGFLSAHTRYLLRSIERVKKRHIKTPEAEFYAVAYFFAYLMLNRSPEDD